MAIYQEYLKNKDGEVFSPITSSDSIYLPESLGGGNSTNFLKQINSFIENYNKKHLNVSSGEGSEQILVKIHIGSYSRFLVQVSGTLNFSRALPIFSILKFNIDSTGTQILDFTYTNIQNFNNTIQFNSTLSNNIISLTVSNIEPWTGLYFQILANKNSTLYFE